jgi:hypothetical protein
MPVLNRPPIRKLAATATRSPRPPPPSLIAANPKAKPSALRSTATMVNRSGSSLARRSSWPMSNALIVSAMKIAAVSMRGSMSGRTTSSNSGASTATTMVVAP